MIIIHDVLWEWSVAAGQHAVYAAARPHSFRLHTNTYLSLTNYCQSKLYNYIIIILISKLQLQIWLAIQHRVVRCLAPACGRQCGTARKQTLPIMQSCWYGSSNCTRCQIWVCCLEGITQGGVYHNNNINY